VDQDDVVLGVEDAKAPEATVTPSDGVANVVLVGAMGAGKSAVGWQLAHLIGFGFIDLDRYIERRERKTIAQLFEKGEPHFREREAIAVASLSGIRSHVVAVGGGALMNDANWDVLTRLGAMVWLNPAADEIARRLTLDISQLKKRPLLADIAEVKDKEERQKVLTERLTALIGQRQERYSQAQVAVTDSFSTPESTAQLVRSLLVREKMLSLLPDHRPFDRWRML
jgi:shikimate kinase